MHATSLIVRADEFGLCHAANQAILEGLESGVVTCATLMACGPWVAEAAELARSHPQWEVGLHLVLHCDTAGCRWGPVTGPAAVPGLVGPTGTFGPHLPAAIRAEEVMGELEAQVERARAWGVTPAYLDYGGEHPPAVEGALHALSERCGIPRWPAGLDVRCTFRREADCPFDALATLGGLSSGVHVWVVRPARETPETWALWPDETQARLRHADALAVCDPQVIALLAGRGIELRRLTPPRTGTPAAGPPAGTRG
jgi:hypothetical protein